MARFRRTRGKAGHSSAALFYKKIKLVFFSPSSWCKNWEVKDQSLGNYGILNLDGCGFYLIWEIFLSS